MTGFTRILSLRRIIIAIVSLPWATVLVAQDVATPFADDSTGALVERAIARHRIQDSLVTDYTARIRFRMSFALGRRQWSLAPTLAVQEQEGTVQWQAPNDLRVDLLGMRSRARNPEWSLSADLDTPWFVPRGLGDSVRVVGSEFPARAAVHPFSSAGPQYYRYEPGDTVSIVTGGGRRLRLAAVRVLPRQTAGALVAGWLWLDLETAEVVRFTFRYVGTDLWVAPDQPTRRDSADARRANRWIHRILSLDADLEYALQDGAHWMPYRQVMAGRFQVPFVGDIVVPFEVVTTFSDYEINTGRPIVFHLPPPDTTDRGSPSRRERRDSLRAERRRRLADSLPGRHSGGYRAGGRYEIYRAPRDTLRAYAGWVDSLSLETSPADDRRLRDAQTELARLAETLPSELTGVRRFGIAYERLADVFRYNRVQGWSAGLSYGVKLPAPSFTRGFGTVRYGISDERLYGSIALVRDAPGGRLRLGGYRDLRDVDPVSRGTGLGASLRSVFFARDEADYFLAQGASISWERSLSRGLDLTLAARLERQRSVAAEARSAVNDVLGGSGLFLPNPPITEGGFGVLAARLDGHAGRHRWWLASDAIAGGGEVVGRLYGHLRGQLGERGGATVRASAGIATRPTPPQAAFRAGGVHSVRGFDYGTQAGPAMWALQADWTPLAGSRRPVLFVDAGQAGSPDELHRSPMLVGAGVGYSILRGLLRFDLSHPITPDQGGLRFDIAIGAPR